MKVLPFKVSKTINSSFLIQVDDQPYFYDILHKHPELQLTTILESDGTVLIDDYVGNFKAGDVFLINSNVPHVFKNDKKYYTESEDLRALGISIFFEETLFGEKFFKLPETQLVGQFLSKRQSLKLNRNTAELLIPKITRLQSLNNLSKVIEMLSILEILASAEDSISLTSEVTHDYTELQAKRLNDIYQFTMNEFHREITLEEVADVSNMTVPSFCRYFKKRTRKTYIEFLTEMRVSYACKLLQKEDLSITGVCHLSGFNNLSNFNRKFKKITGYTPTVFRKINHNL
ncbi:helix-turn-helix domain-containing protein [Fulvivirga sp. 29W222]|uniref:Helix-turn-helix domain-containing protein n=1 Tax=Fulvivirga marina TaxID=2494733 RepID=A0A937FVK1_9BACT|nr:AraC family transcriptional regulator [Fulvivirga marina]MBL6445140.1 helix-turn-helix domain-containing protein [Fulvivirga marina]